MEPPKGFLATLWNFICFLPYFIGLLLLGTIKGIIFCPLIFLIMTIGNSSIILGLLPFHGYWTCYSILRTKLLGPFLKLIICLCLPVVLILWVVVGIVGSIIGGILYGFLSPIFATFDAVREGKTNVFIHCFYDGTWSTIKRSFTVIRDFKDVSFHSYISFMEDLKNKGPPNGKYYEIRFLYLPPALIAALLGYMVDFPVISLIALCKSPYMLFKGWHRLFHDLIGREGPFLETLCVPFAGLSILFWPLAVVGAVLGSMASSIFLGAYAGVVVYQSEVIQIFKKANGAIRVLILVWALLYCCLSIYDEYSNDVLDMPEGSCFSRSQYRRNKKESISNASSFSKSDSFKPCPPARADSLTNTRIDLKPLELLEGLFKECRCHGEEMVSEGLITPKDIEDAKSRKGSRVISIGLPAYCLFQTLLRSVKANKSGILLSKLQGITKSVSRYPASRRHFENFVNTRLEDLAKKNSGSNSSSNSSSNGAHPVQRSKSGIARVFSNKSFKGNTSYNMFDLESQSVIARDIEIE
ncbi:hypothetical protein CRYUN_Cryun22dG0011900 [Craigia yunnanensis]